MQLGLAKEEGQLVWCDSVFNIVNICSILNNYAKRIAK